MFKGTLKFPGQVTGERTVIKQAGGRGMGFSERRG